MVYCSMDFLVVSPMNRSAKVLQIFAVFATFQAITNFFKYLILIFNHLQELITTFFSFPYYLTTNLLLTPLYS